MIAVRALAATACALALSDWHTLTHVVGESRQASRGAIGITSPNATRPPLQAAGPCGMAHRRPTRLDQHLAPMARRPQPYLIPSYGQHTVCGSDRVISSLACGVAALQTAGVSITQTRNLAKSTLNRPSNGFAVAVGPEQPSRA